MVSSLSLSLSSVVLLVYLLSSFLVISVSSSASYTVYSDPACNTAVASGNGIATTSTTLNGITVYQTACFPVSGINSVAGGIIECSSDGTTLNAISLYETNQCGQLQTWIAYSGGGNNKCVVNGQTSAAWTCNSANSVETLSLSLILMLAIILTFIM